MFSKILIANRGEIACRIMRTAQRMGIATVAVYSQADAQARHVRLADQAVAIGPAPASDSYLHIDRIIEAAWRSGAQAIHPGYGFLSENADFAATCMAKGLTFIGPTPSAIRTMGDKSAAKAMMARAGVPLTPGYHGDEQDADFLAGQAEQIGYPVLIKARSGGGGKGMRRVDHPTDFAAALAACRREAHSAFGDERVLIETYVLTPRHIEVQVFADQHGHCVHMFERDCSVQRRHQKVMEEAPAPGMSPERRAAMGLAAVAAARAVGYVGAGTVEFIVQPDGRFFFMEMNTRLQVEHPVTEMITGLDLVEWQLRVAAGEPLPLTQADMSLQGHAIEARIYAEDADRGFLPSSGRVIGLEVPADVRLDRGVDVGDAVTHHYDPLLAKLVVWGEDRSTACRRMRRALEQTWMVGVRNNIDFLRRLVDCPSVAQGNLDTALIEREHDQLFASSAQIPDAVFCVATVALLSANRTGLSSASADVRDAAWLRLSNWRMNGQLQRRCIWQGPGADYDVDIRADLVGPDWTFHLCRKMRRKTCPTNSGALAAPAQPETRVPVVIRVAQAAGSRGSGAESGQAGLSRAGSTLLAAPQVLELTVQVDGLQSPARVWMVGSDCHVQFEGRQHCLQPAVPLPTNAHTPSTTTKLIAPLPGRVVARLAQEQALLKRGDPVLVMEAMKMEHTLVAPADGMLEAFGCAIGAQVPEGAVLVSIAPTEIVPPSSADD